MLVLIGLPILIGGFLLRFNPLLIVAAAALATGLAAGIDLTAVLAAFGKAFNEQRFIMVPWLVLPLVGLLERHGLQARGRALMARLRGVGVARLLISYMAARQLTAGLGLTSVMGQPQTVRPLLAPMAEAAAKPRDEDERERVVAMAAATDTIGLLFGEDIFLAIGSILLMQGLFATQGIALTPLQMSLWAIPPAVAAFLIHGVRLWRFGPECRPVIGLGFVYVVAGAVFVAYAILSATDRRWRNAALWGLLATSFLFGDRLGDSGNGVLVAAIVLLATLRLAKPRPAEAGSPRGDGLFAVALIVPGVALAGTLLARWRPGLLDPKQASLISLVIGILVALAVAGAWLRPRPATPLREGLRLMDTIGPILLLPQLLAAFGAILTLAKVGPLVGGYAGAVLPPGNLLAAVIAYAAGMWLLTVLMGNAFAAFPIMAAAIGIPVLVHEHHGSAAAVAALGMLCGFCGTLCTPMAANFNLVPPALLELKDRYATIRAQVPTALPLWVACTAILYGFAF